MAVYRYQAFDKAGKEISGVLEADTDRRVRQQLRDKGLTPLQVALSGKSSSKSSKQHRELFSSISLSELALITRELANLISAALPIDEALTAVSEQISKVKVRNKIVLVRAKVLEGYSFAKALGEYPKDFSKVYRSTVAAGEESGHLDTVLNRLADHTEQQVELRHKIQQALIYPAIMTSVSLLIVTFLLAVVVPSMVEVFSDFNRQLPLATRILLAVSDGVRDYGIYIAVFIAALSFGWKMLLKKDAFKYSVHRFNLRLPVIGKNLRIVNTARFCRTLGILSSAGVTVLDAMRISASLVSNMPMREAIESATQKVQEGVAISLALKQTGYFLPITIHFIANGEKSGFLSEMLQRAAEHQEQHVKRVISASLTLFEPILILLMGCIVLFIVLAILLPMFDMTQLI